MDRTELRAELERLTEKLLDPHYRPGDREEWVDMGVAIRNTLDEIRNGVDTIDAEVIALLSKQRAETERCANPGCNRWMLVTKGVGRRRRTCSPACRTALARSR